MRDNSEYLMKFTLFLLHTLDSQTPKEIQQMHRYSMHKERVFREAPIDTDKLERYFLLRC